VILIVLFISYNIFLLLNILVISYTLCKLFFLFNTDASRPAAWIQWYIGGQNVTNQATSHPPQQDGEKFISSSSLVYTGRDVDHNTVIFCEAVNIKGRQKVKSTDKSFYIQCKYYLPCNYTTSVLGCFLYEIINL
jgi:hypothetical protein